MAKFQSRLAKFEAAHFRMRRILIIASPFSVTSPPIGRTKHKMELSTEVPANASEI